MTSIRTPVIPRSNVDGCDVHGWPHVNRWRWRVVNRRWRSDVERLRCESAADNGSDAKSHQPCTNGRAIACMGRAGKRECSDADSRYYGYSVHGAHSENPSLGNNAAPTHDKLRVSSRSDFRVVKGLEKEGPHLPRGAKAKQRPLAIGGLCQICTGLGDNTAIRYEVLATGDRL
jgi:hypothetical protein